jgi:hypothetical protein
MTSRRMVIHVSFVDSDTSLQSSRTVEASKVELGAVFVTQCCQLLKLVGAYDNEAKAQAFGRSTRHGRIVAKSVNLSSSERELLAS